MVLFFTYNENIPAANNNPSVDQPNMQTNTNSIDSIIDVDHFSFETNFDGTHKQVQLRDTAGINGAIPAGLQGNGWETLYTSATAGVGELWFVRGAAGTGIQLTGPGTPSVVANGYTFLPGGILLQWGTVTGIAGVTHVQSNTLFNIPFPNACLVVNATPKPIAGGVTSQATISINTLSTTQFNWVYNKDTGTSYTAFSWIAIGN